MVVPTSNLFNDEASLEDRIDNNHGLISNMNAFLCSVNFVVLGHDIKHCAKYYARSKNGNKVVCQYGEWLNSAGVCPRLPSRMGSNMNMHPSNVARNESQAKNANTKMPAAEEETTKENPTKENSHAFGKSVDFPD